MRHAGVALLISLGGSPRMRWLMLSMLVSLVALLMAAAGMARHIWVHHARLRNELSKLDTPQEQDLEP